MMPHMDAELSHVAAKTAGWIVQQGLDATRGQPRAALVESMNKVEKRREAFVAACVEAGTLAKVPGWVKSLMRQSGAITADGRPA